MWKSLHNFHIISVDNILIRFTMFPLKSWWLHEASIVNTCRMNSLYYHQWHVEKMLITIQVNSTFSLHQAATHILRSFGYYFKCLQDEIGMSLQILNGDHPDLTEDTFRILNRDQEYILHSIITINWNVIKMSFVWGSHLHVVFTWDPWCHSFW